MKRTVAFLLIFATLLTSTLMTSCQNDAANETDTSADTAQEEVVSNTIKLIENGESVYPIVRSDYDTSDDPETRATIVLRKAIESAAGVYAELTTDWVGRDGDPDTKKDVKEILVGHTNRSETAKAIEGLGKNEYIITIVDNKIVICGYDDILTRRAVNRFVDEFITADNASLEIPADLHIVEEAQYGDSVEHGMAYDEMGDVVLSAFVRDYYGRGSLPNTEFWDAAEILECFIDAYEQTGNDEYLSFVESIIKKKFGLSDQLSWESNEYNDDVAWGCIAYARTYLLTKDTENANEKYLTIAKNNFDMMYERAISDDLGGGLFWRTDNQTKNSCVNCPASIAACLIGDATGDDTYYEKAKDLMEWEFAHMFNQSSGAVYDAYNLKGEISTWASTYNQGTFIGACTFLHKKYGDEKYLTYAAKAAEYAMTKLANSKGVLNGEGNTNDLIGFKGILVRWMYRYGEYLNELGDTEESMNVLNWLQLNADTAFKNRNSQNLIWTEWANKTPEDVSDKDIYGFSPAIALLFNCQPWD